MDNWDSSSESSFETPVVAKINGGRCLKSERGHREIEVAGRPTQSPVHVPKRRNPVGETRQCSAHVSKRRNSVWETRQCPVHGSKPRSSVGKTSRCRVHGSKRRHPVGETRHKCYTTPCKNSKPVKAMSPTMTRQPTPAVVKDSNPRWSVASSATETSTASSSNWSFTTGCYTVATDTSSESVDSVSSVSSLSTVRPRRESISSVSSLSTVRSVSSCKKIKSSKSISAGYALPQGAKLLSKDEYPDYWYVSYVDKKGNMWGKMFPKEVKAGGH